MDYKKLLEVQNKTLLQVITCLKTYRFCNMVRPVGFGKTYLLSRLVEENEWSDVVYFYPTTVVKLQSLKDMCNKRIIYISYNKLARLAESPKDLYKFKKNTLFIFDESTFVCGSKTFIAYSKLCELYESSCYFIGSSANQLRKDGIDVTEKAFKNHSVSYYDLNMGIKDNIYSKISYYFCNFRLDDMLEEVSTELVNQDSWSSSDSSFKSKYQDYLKNKILKVSNVIGASSVYKNGINKCILKERQNYMRFLVYFYSDDILEKQCKSLKEDFISAFPGKTINIMKVLHKQDLNELYNLSVSDNTIDLIVSTGSLQFGYHDKDLTGVILFRSTDSEVVFSQTALRGMSVVNTYGTLIFDMVGNSYKAQKRYFKGIKMIRLPNSGGTGYIEPYNIELFSTQQEVDSIFNNVELDRIKKAIKLEPLIKKNIIPIQVACKELGLSSKESYDFFMSSIEDVKSLLA